MKKVTGTSKPVERRLAVERYYSGTNVRFVNHLLMYNSIDPNWDKAKVFSAFFYINSALEKGMSSEVASQSLTIMEIKRLSNIMKRGGRFHQGTVSSDGIVKSQVYLLEVLENLKGSKVS
jgi:hypothetical protein